MRGSVRGRVALPLLTVTALVVVAAGASEPLAAPPKTTGAALTSSFDYTATASTGHAFVTGTGLVPGSQQDDGVADLALPFPVTFYGTSYGRGATLALGTNGNIQFPGGTNPPMDTADPGCTLPDGRFERALFLYQGDLDLSADPGDGIFTRVQGTAPNRKLYVEWRGPDYRETVVNHFEAIFPRARRRSACATARRCSRGSTTQAAFSRPPTARRPSSRARPQRSRTASKSTTTGTRWARRRRLHHHRRPRLRHTASCRTRSASCCRWRRRGSGGRTVESERSPSCIRHAD